MSGNNSTWQHSFTCVRLTIYTPSVIAINRFLVKGSLDRVAFQSLRHFSAKQDYDRAECGMREEQQQMHWITTPGCK